MKPSRFTRTASHHVSTSVPFEDWAAVVEALDALPNELPKKSNDFIISLREDPPLRLTENQVLWLKDLERDYLL